MMNSKRKNRVAIIGTVGVPACYGGFETLAEHLIEQTAAKQDITVYCSGKSYAKADRKPIYKGAKLKYIPIEANGVQSIAYDSWSIIHALFTNDVLLVLGVAGAWLFPLIRWFTSKRIIVSIDGIEWKRDKWGRFAKLYLWWAESVAVRFSHIDISDNESIQDYTAQRYGTLSQIIEYGADHASAVKATADDKKEFPFLNNNYAFKVCRIEPENNVEMILQAFADLSRYNFVLVGNWEKSEFSKDLHMRYSGYENIHLIHPIYDQRKLDVLRSNAYVYVHGHSAGGTNPSLVEAMYLGRPIFSYGVSYNRTTTDHKALYFNDIDQLKTLILETSFAQLLAVGQQMERIAKARYTWQVIGKKYGFLIAKAFKMNQKGAIRSRVQFAGSKRLLKSDLAHLDHQSMFFEA